MNHTFVIAEAGSNHESNLATAFRLIDIAKWAGADACKFQYWSSSERLAARRNAPELAEMYERCRIPSEWLPELKSCCDRVGTEFMCTAYLPEDIEVIAPLVRRFKVSSFEAEDKEFIEAHQSRGKETIISCNANVLSPARWSIKDTRALHCVSAYPCPSEQLNLSVLNSWPFNTNGGLSDHTKNPLTGALAVACGAKYIETHSRLDSTSPDAPDYEVSKTPGELKIYIDNIRQAEILLGDGTKRLQECEKPYLKYRVMTNAVGSAVQS